MKKYFLFLLVLVLSCFAMSSVVADEQCPPGECGPELPPPPVHFGSPEINPTIGICQQHYVLKTWQCVPRYPHFTDALWSDYHACETDGTRTIGDCLKDWASQKSLIICGVTTPSTRDPQIPGSGEIEVPYSGDVAELGDYETHYQCTGENIAPEKWSELIPLRWWYPR